MVRTQKTTTMHSNGGTGGRERQINVQRQNYSVIDNEFDNMRDRFEAEMTRVEDEMSRLRREFEGTTFVRLCVLRR